MLLKKLVLATASLALEKHETLQQIEKAAFADEGEPDRQALFKNSDKYHKVLPGRLSHAS
ncbi:hypothetical protein LguiB_005944 [Lonicera macranthoides]